MPVVIHKVSKHPMNNIWLRLGKGLYITCMKVIDKDMNQPDLKRHYAPDRLLEPA